ncbi:Ferric-chelate reductase 1 [Halotydeus destructor]|nr:Ferric-chelate reductase 1 [Halotydeus destructor]
MFIPFTYLATLALAITSVQCHNYEGCQTGGSYLCSGLPLQCIDDKSCSLLFKSTFDHDHKVLIGEIYGKVESSTKYFSVGFNPETSSMSPASVVDCIVQRDGAAVVKPSFNHVAGDPRKTNSGVKYETGSLSTVQAFVEDGVVMCKFNRSDLVMHRGQDFSVLGKKYFIVLASGNLKADTNDKAFHSLRAATISAEALTSTGSLKAGNSYLSTGLSKAHAILMLIAWLWVACTGVLAARQFRNVLSEKTFLGGKFWFAIHRPFMASAVVLALTGATLIFIHRGGWSGPYLHPIVGVLCNTLAFLQVGNALIRCHPGDDKRWIFDYVHRATGYSAHCLAYVAIYVSKKFVEPDYHDAYLAILICQFVIYIISHVALEVKRRLTMKNTTAPIGMSVMNQNGGSVQNNNMGPKSGSKDDKFHLNILLVFVCLNSLFVLLMSIIVIKSS